MKGNQKVDFWRWGRGTWERRKKGRKDKGLENDQDMLHACTNFTSRFCITNMHKINKQTNKFGIRKGLENIPKNIRGLKGHILVNLPVVFAEEMLNISLDPFI